MKYAVVLTALTAAVSSLPTPQLPQLINAGPFSLQLDAPGTDLHELYISIQPTPVNPENNKALAITTTSKTPNARFEIAYNHPSEDPRVPQHGKLVYTPGESPEECKFFLCPSKSTPAGFDENFGPVEYVRDNMKAVFFSPPAAEAAPAPKNGPLNVWNDFQLDFLGFLTLDGQSNWWACPTRYPLGQKETYTSVWWAEGSVSDDRCRKVKVRRA
ncbi:hypothetical protein ABW20_dc0100015 [Dactylellina cionopaga]|nr:hypothetical protein ABW20_dc0100015 [Dactylellina cionopaga]